MWALLCDLWHKLESVRTADFFAFVGGLTGPIALYLQWRNREDEKPSLKLRAVLHKESSSQNPIEHYRLEVVVQNAGRRTIRIISAGLELNPALAKVRGMIVTDAKIDLFKAEWDGPAVLNEYDQRKIEADPLDPIWLLGQNGEATVFVIDAVDRKSTCTFFVPKDEEIQKVIDAQRGKSP
jgi:hypothetical protein